MFLIKNISRIYEFSNDSKDYILKLFILYNERPKTLVGCYELKGVGPLEKRSERINKEKQLLHRQPSFKILKPLSIKFAVASLVLSGLAQVTGQTYSSFNDTESISGQIKTCGVFPSAIQESYEELDQHLKNVIQLSNAIYTFEQNPLKFEQPAQLTQNATPDQLMQMSSDIKLQIQSYKMELQSIDGLHSKYSEDKKILLNELDGIEQVIIKLNHYETFDSKCTTIDNTEIRTKLIDKYRKSDFLPSTYRKELAELLDLTYMDASSGNSENAKKEITNDLDKVLSFLEQKNSLLSTKMKELEDLTNSLKEDAEKKKEEIVNEITVKEDNESENITEQENNETVTGPSEPDHKPENVKDEPETLQDENENNNHIDADPAKNITTSNNEAEEVKDSSTDQDIEIPPTNDVSEEEIIESPPSSTEAENQK